MLYTKWLKLFISIIFVVAHGLTEHHEPHAELHAPVKVCERKHHGK